MTKAPFRQSFRVRTRESMGERAGRTLSCVETLSTTTARCVKYAARDFHFRRQGEGDAAMWLYGVVVRCDASVVTSEMVAKMPIVRPEPACNFERLPTSLGLPLCQPLCQSLSPIERQTSDLLWHYFPRCALLSHACPCIQRYPRCIARYVGDVIRR